MLSCPVQLFATPWIIACQTPLSMGILQTRILETPCPPPGELPNPGIELRYPELHVDSLPTEPQGKPKNTGVGSRSLLQGIFLTQELNQGLLHCRQILYQLRYQGSPKVPIPEDKYTAQVDAEEKKMWKAVLSFCLSQRPGFRNMRKSWRRWGTLIPFDQMTTEDLNEVSPETKLDK